MKFVDGWWWPDGERHMLDWIADPKNRLVLNGRATYQGKKQVAVLATCPPERRRTMVDVGAHIGLWSYNFSHWFNCIEAFEPVAAHRECWQSNMQMRQDEASLHPYALGAEAGKVAISVNPTSSGDSWIKGHGSVEMRTLDSFALSDVDLIKIDCEGYEEFVLRGAADTIATWRPVICVEQKRDMARKFGLEPLGAVRFLVGSMNYKTAQEIGGDFIMVPR
jgi:FkbM family methyltransferase